MSTAYSKVVWTVGFMSVSVAALAAEPKAAGPQEPAGFVTGGIIGGFAAGPVGAVIGAGIGSWLGNRVHRASTLQTEQRQLQAEKQQLQAETQHLQAENGTLTSGQKELSATNHVLTVRVDQLSHVVEAAQNARDESVLAATQEISAKVLNGLQGDLHFRTGSAEISPEMAQGIQVLAEAVAKSPALKVRLDGFADTRGTVDANLKLSEARANAVRELFLAAGVSEEALEINAYGKSQSVAEDPDGLALDRRVRLTLQADVASVAQADGLPSGDATSAGRAASGNE
jgi:outer membrane protein OmpA-like peptidoglycan-associated protein